MYRFLFHAFLIILLSLVLLGGLIQFNSKELFFSWYTYVQVKNKIAAGEIKIPNTKILALGNSQALSAFVASEIPSSYNLAYPGTSVIENYYLLKKYLENHAPPKVLLYGLFPQNEYLHYYNFWNLHIRYGGYKFDELLEVYLNARKLNNYLMFDGNGEGHFLNAVKYLYNSLCYKFNCPSAYQASLKALLFRHYSFLNYNLMQEDLLKNLGFFSISTPPVINEEVRTHLLKFQKNNKDKFVVEPLLRFYFDKLLGLLKTYNIKLVYYQMPNHPVIKEAIGANTINESSQYYRDYFSKNYPNSIYLETISLQSGDFAELQHPNKDGALKFTKALKEDLLKMNIIQ